MARPVLARFAFVSVLVLPATAGVLIVDAKLSTGFVDIQSAVDAAHDGDTLLVKSGSYAGFTLVDKELTVVADELNDVQIVGTIVVEKLSAQKTVLLTGLSAIGREHSGGNGARFVDNDGIVWIEGCSLRAAPSQACATPTVAMHVENSDRVVLIRTELRGSDALFGEGGGGDGLHLIDSSALTHNCGVLGGVASWQKCGAGPLDGANGGSAALVSGSSFLFTSADRYMAGDGGSGSHGAAGGDGGSGLIALEPSLIESFDTMYIAGAGGFGSGCGLPKCDDGSTGVETSGSVHTLAGEAATFTGGPPVREGMPVMVVVYGIPGERFAFDISTDADFRYVPKQRGVRLTKGGRRLALGYIPPSGAIGVMLTAPILAPSEQSRRLFVQSVHWGSSGPLTLGSVRAIVVLDSAL